MGDLIAQAIYVVGSNMHAWRIELSGFMRDLLLFYIYIKYLTFLEDGVKKNQYQGVRNENKFISISNIYFFLAINCNN